MSVSDVRLMCNTLQVVVSYLTVIILIFCRMKTQLLYFLQNRTIEAQAHLFQKHGIKDVLFTSDSNFIFTLGFDGVIDCLKLKFLLN